MRKLHRWGSVIFGLLVIFMAITGLCIHFTEIYDHGGLTDQHQPVNNQPLAISKTPATPDASKVSAKTSRPQAGEGKHNSFGEFFRHLHTGESFGPLGTVLSILAGLAVLFFAVSGLTMYMQMFRNRLARGLTRLFWR